MKKFRFLFIVAVVVVFALSLTLIAGASASTTAETYEQIYVGEYDSIDVDANGNPYTGEAYVVFGKVTGTDEAGIILERYSNSDKTYSDAIETRYFPVRAGRISNNGEFGIALYNVADGYYKAKVIAGDYRNPTSVGEYVTFSKGEAIHTVTFWALDGTDKVYTYQVPNGGTVIPPVIEREGYELAGWETSTSSPTYGYTYENNPAYFKNITADKTYSPRWIWVGENGDYKAPEVFKLDMKGYSKLSVKYTGTSDKVNIPAGSVGIMSFDVLEDAAYTFASIGLNSTDSDFWYTAVNADTDDRVFLPTYYNGTFHEYNSIANVTNSTSVLMHPGNVLKEGKSVILVYKPYESDANPGWLCAYAKSTGSSADYTLLAGFENLSATQAKSTSMPCIAAGSGAIGGAGSLSMALANLQVGIDTDGDYTTTDDFNDMGIGISALSYDSNANRYVNIDTDYIHSSQVVYGVKMANVEQNDDRAVMMSNAQFTPSDFSVNDGERFEMTYTVLKSNANKADEQGTAPLFAFGMTSGSVMNTGFSSQYGYGFSIDWKTGAILAGGGLSTDYSNSPNIIYTGYGVPAEVLFTADTQVKYVIAMDTVDDGNDIGYSHVYYKTSDMDDYALAGSMTNVGYVAMSHIGGYPMLYSESQYTNNPWRLDMDVTSVILRTYDSSDNITKSASIQMGTTFNEREPNEVAVAKHTVTFIDANGNVIDTQEVEDRKGAIAPVAPSVEGYDFDKWDVDFSYVRGDMTVQAIYKLEEFEVAFKIDGELYATRYYTVANPVVDVPELPVRQGYSAKWEYFRLPAGDIVVNAIYTLKDGYYTVNFRNADGDVINTQTVAEGESAEAPAVAPFKVSYYFDGWAEDFTNVQSDLDIDPVFKTVSSVSGLKLYKSENDTFKILNLADIQVLNTETSKGQGQLPYHPDYADQDAAVWNAVRALIEEEKPDLIVLNGDNIYSQFDFADMRTHRKLMEVIDNYNTPWTLIFGNHDGEAPGDTDFLFSDLVSIYSESEYFIIEPALNGEYGNHAISLVDKETGKLVNKFFYMYTHYSSGWYTDAQLAWYENEASKLNDGESVVPSIFWSHYPLPELQDALVNKYNDYATHNGTKFTGMIIPENDNGDWGEYNSAGYGINYGMFDLMKEHQSTQLTIHGHEHSNNAKVSFEGIMMGYALKTGLYDQSVNHRYLNGGTVIVLDADGAGYEMYDNFVYDDSRDIGGRYEFNTTYTEPDMIGVATIRTTNSALVAANSVATTLSETVSASISFDIVTPPMSSDSTTNENICLGFRVMNIRYPSNDVWAGHDRYHMSHYSTEGCHGGLVDSGLVDLYTWAEHASSSNKYYKNSVNEVFGRGRSIKYTVSYDGMARIYTKLASEDDTKWVLLSSVTLPERIDVTQPVYLAFHTNRDIRVRNFTVTGNTSDTFTLLNCRYIEE